VSDWHVDVPARLGEEVGRLTPGGRRAVHDALARLAKDPRTGAEEPVTGAEIRRILTEPAADNGDRITLLYRVHGDEDPRRVEIIFLLAGP